MQNKAHTILYVGDMNSDANSWSRSKEFEKMGHNVIRLSYTRVENKGLGYVKMGFWWRVFWKLGFHLDDQRVNPKILKIVEEKRPDIVWIDKGNMIKPTVLKRIKQRFPVTKLISSSEDNMYAWHNRTWFYAYGLKYYDIVFTCKSYNCNSIELPSLGARRVIMVYQSFDDEQCFPIGLTQEDNYYRSEVSFIGSYEKARAESIYYLAQHGITVRIWGNHWEDCKKIHPNMRVEYKPVINDQRELGYTKAVCGSKINLSFLRKMNFDLHTIRSVEIPACGGFMLAERTVDHQYLFEEGKEAEFFGSNQELLEKVKYYLAHEEERKQIALAGRERCIRDGYSFKERLKFVLSKIEECSL